MKLITQAVILCGGLGTRLGNITKVVPKPMVDVKGKPFLEHIIIQLKKNGIKEILLLVGYKSQIIKNYFKDGKKLGVNIIYTNEKKPLGTCGALSLIKIKSSA